MANEILVQVGKFNKYKNKYQKNSPEPLKFIWKICREQKEFKNSKPQKWHDNTTVIINRILVCVYFEQFFKQ